VIKHDDRVALRDAVGRRGRAEVRTRVVGGACGGIGGEGIVVVVVVVAVVVRRERPDAPPPPPVPPPSISANDARSDISCITA
jgi:hypothetical protein